MTEIIDLLLALSQEIKNIDARIKQLKDSRAVNLKDMWIDSQDVMLTLHISQRTLHTLRKNGTLPYSRIRGKFYYKVSDIEELLNANYYNPNFKCDENR